MEREGLDWEGWFTDPFGRHDARWLSQGIPTKLVRDRGIESFDNPPDEVLSLVPEPITGAVGIRRADQGGRHGGRSVGSSRRGRFLGRAHTLPGASMGRHSLVSDSENPRFNHEDFN